MNHARSFLYAKYVMPVLLESVTLPDTWQLWLWIRRSLKERVAVIVMARDL